MNGSRNDAKTGPNPAVSIFSIKSIVDQSDRDKTHIFVMYAKFRIESPRVFLKMILIFNQERFEDRFPKWVNKGFSIFSIKSIVDPPDRDKTHIFVKYPQQGTNSFGVARYRTWAN